MKPNTLLAIAAIAALAGAASATEVAVNGGFETGDFTGWSQFGNTGFTGVGFFAGPHSGANEAFFGPVGSTGGISQSMAVLAGDVVTISFWLYNTGGTPNSFSADFDGANLMSLSDAGAFEYTHYSFSGIVVGSAGASLSFTMQHTPGWYVIDDVSVDVARTVVPMPTAAGLSIAGLTLVGLRRRR